MKQVLLENVQIESYPDISGTSWTVVSEKRTFYRVFKRLVDLVLCSLALLILWPFMVLIAIAIRLESNGPAIFRQERVGQNGKTFTMYKFRSMVVNAEHMLDNLKELNECDGPVFKITNDPRLTKIGTFLRKSSLDEIPQFFNILRGDMSLVGPRPPLPCEVTEYTSYEWVRLNVKPGLTCYWQISGRSDLPFEQWMKLDIKYIHERSVKTDLKIILKTFPAVLGGKGAY